MVEQRDKYIEHLVSVLVLSIVIIGCFFVLRPFLSALLWAVILSFSTWPIYKWWEKLLKGKKTLAATIMTLLLSGAFVLPVLIIGLSLASEASTLTVNIRQMLEKGPPNLPSWISSIPIIGHEIQNYWNEWTIDHERLADILLPYIKTLKGVIIEKGALMGQAIFQIILSIIVCFFFYRDGEETAQSFANFLKKIAGSRADRLINVAASTTKGVVYGVLGTAAVQGTLAGIGFFIVGVPAALLLGLFTFFLALIPMGPPLLWIPVTVWLFYYKSTVAWIFMLIWGTFIISGIDNIVKPILISQGIDLPFILILLGVFGGIIAFGFIGIFLGPTLLALGYSLISEWTSSKEISVS